MSDEPAGPDEQEQDDFASAAEEAQPGILREFWDFLRYNKKWWIAPIVIVLLLLSGLVILLNTALPFIYPLF